jgi:hypothetical protein
MLRTQRFRINSPAVINDTLEGESVIINLQTGIYYSLDNIGSVIWNGLINQYSVEEIVSALNTRFGEEEEIIRGVDGLTEELIKEHLIVALTEEKKRNTEFATAIDLEKAGLSDGCFTQPVLNRFGDMRDLLLLDPIHEVDEAGWPYSKPEDAN